MTEKIIQEQINVIRDATIKASASRESAATFLQKAGIIDAPIIEKSNPDSTKLKKG